MSKRNLILKQTLLLLSDKDFDSISTKQIARSCEISEVTLFKYFPKKEMIFDAISQTGSEQFFGEVKKLAQFISNPYERLISIASLVSEFTLKNPILVKVCYREMLFNQNRNSKLEKGFTDYLYFIEEILKEGVEKGIFKKTLRPEFYKYYFLNGALLFVLKQKIENKDCLENKQELVTFIVGWFKDLLWTKLTDHERFKYDG